MHGLFAIGRLREQLVAPFCEQLYQLLVREQQRQRQQQQRQQLEWGRPRNQLRIASQSTAGNRDVVEGADNPPVNGK